MAKAKEAPEVTAISIQEAEQAAVDAAVNQAPPAPEVNDDDDA